VILRLWEFDSPRPHKKVRVLLVLRFFSLDGGSRRKAVQTTLNVQGSATVANALTALRAATPLATRDQTHAEGWDYDADIANVVVYGQACEQLKGAGATSNVQIIFGCPGIIIE
jgi:hypothetical protein